MNIPISLTMLRVALIPVFILCFYWHSLTGYIATIFIFVIAALTDWLDGFLARSLSQTSKLGAFLDPVADKLIVCTALVLLVNVSTQLWIAVPVVAIVCREIAVSALREWMAEVGLRSKVAVSTLGKIKTTAQMTAIILLLIGRRAFIFNQEYIVLLGIILLNIAAALSLWTLYAYSRAAWGSMKAD